MVNFNVIRLIWMDPKDKAFPRTICGELESALAKIDTRGVDGDAATRCRCRSTI